MHWLPSVLLPVPWFQGPFCCLLWSWAWLLFLMQVLVFRQAEVSPKNKSTCLGGTFCLHAGCHSFCDKDSGDASTVTAQEKAYECEILPNHCWYHISSWHPGLVGANSTLSWETKYHFRILCFSSFFLPMISPGCMWMWTLRLYFVYGSCSPGSGSLLALTSDRFCTTQVCVPPCL